MWKNAKKHLAKELAEQSLPALPTEFDRKTDRKKQVAKLLFAKGKGKSYS